MNQSARLFDRYIMIDWSARTGKATGKDSIWIGTGFRGADGALVVSSVNPATRTLATDRIRGQLQQAIAAGERVLVGFDFAYGYPRGFAKRLGLEGAAWEATWQLLDELIDDSDLNFSNRFNVAAALNRRCGLSSGPFWGHDGGVYPPELSRTGTNWAQCALPQFRYTEDTFKRGTVKSTWQLFGAGSVGSQTLLGIPRLSSLRFDPALEHCSRVWPFETGFSSDSIAGDGASIVHVEIWPGVLGKIDVGSRVPDQAQVEDLVGLIADLDDRDCLRSWFEAPAHLSSDDLRVCMEEEGWIFGAGRSVERVEPPPKREPKLDPRPDLGQVIRRTLEEIVRKMTQAPPHSPDRRSVLDEMLHDPTVVHAINEWVMARENERVSLDLGDQLLAAVVLSYPERFSDEVVEICRRRLAAGS